MPTVREYRIPLPFSVEEYRIAQLYMVAKFSQQGSEGDDGDGVEILENRPYEEDGRKGQYTHKVYHLSQKLPSWLVALVPKKALMLEEKAWNAYPHCMTVLTSPYFNKLKLQLESLHSTDRGDSENALSMDKKELKKRLVEWIDIAHDPVDKYVEEEDPTIFRSKKTGRGPLQPGWQKTCEPYMTAYKLVTVDVPYWGFGSRLEKFISKTVQRKVQTEAHRKAFCWLDEWFGLTMDDIRKMEDATFERLNQLRKEKLARQAAEDGGLAAPPSSTLAPLDVHSPSQELDGEKAPGGGGHGGDGTPAPQTPSGGGKGHSSGSRRFSLERISSLGKGGPLSPLQRGASLEKKGALEKMLSGRQSSLGKAQVSPRVVPGVGQVAGKASSGPLESPREREREEPLTRRNSADERLKRQSSLMGPAAMTGFSLDEENDRGNSNSSESARAGGGSAPAPHPPRSQLSGLETYHSGLPTIASSESFAALSPTRDLTPVPSSADLRSAGGKSGAAHADFIGLGFLDRAIAGGRDAGARGAGGAHAGPSPSVVPLQGAGTAAGDARRAQTREKQEVPAAQEGDVEHCLSVLDKLILALGKQQAQQRGADAGRGKSGGPGGSAGALRRMWL